MARSFCSSDMLSTMKMTKDEVVLVELTRAGRAIAEKVVISKQP